MKKNICKIISANLVLFLLLTFFGFKTGDKAIMNFSLKNVDGKIVSLSDYSQAKGFIIVFTCNHCPFAKLYPQRMNLINEKYKPLGVPLIAISSTDSMTYEEDSFSLMIEKSKNEKFNFPYLLDAEQKVAKNFKAQKTPHAFVIWKENNKWIVKYSGAIDDNGMEPQKVKENYVINAVENLLNNKEVLIKETKSIGCQIYFSKK